MKWRFTTGTRLALSRVARLMLTHSRRFRADSTEKRVLDARLMIAVVGILGRQTGSNGVLEIEWIDFGEAPCSRGLTVLTKRIT